jgi:hypothetical protein
MCGRAQSRSIRPGIQSTPARSNSRHNNCRPAQSARQEQQTSRRSLVAIMSPTVLVVTFVIPVAIMVPVALMFAVSFSTVIPIMIVFNSAAVSGPIAHKILVALMTRHHPIGALIWRPSPVALVPSVMPSHWIPIPLHPYEPFSWRRRLNVNDTRRRWCADCDTNRNLRVGH